MKDDRNWVADLVEAYVRKNQGGTEPYAPEVARLFTFISEILDEDRKKRGDLSGWQVAKGLSFDVFRAANLARLPLFKNAKGEIVHPADGSNDWTPEHWLQAVIGEIGEYANLRKKFVRGDFGNFEVPGSGEAESAVRARNEVYANLAKELADVFCYLDLLANSLGINLGAAVIQKFNEVSDRVKVSVKISEDGQSFTAEPPPPPPPPPQEEMFMVVVNSVGAVFVKEFEFFKSEGGLTQEWGRRWVPTRASNIEEARAWGRLHLPGARPYEQQAKP